MNTDLNSRALISATGKREKPANSVQCELISIGNLGEAPNLHGVIHTAYHNDVVEVSIGHDVCLTKGKS